MTVAADIPVRTFLGNGTAAPLPVFRILAPEDVVVTRVAPGNVRTTLTRGVDYSVAGAGTPGATVTPLAPIAVGTSWKIGRATPRSQPTDYVTGDRFPAESHELSLDRQMLAVQEIDAVAAELADRALRVPVGESVLTLPPAAQRAGKYQGWDVTGQPILLPGTGADLLALLPLIRSKLVGDRAYYVRIDGSNANSGLANNALGAFATVQRAIDAAYALDLNGFKVTIFLGPGTHAGEMKLHGKLVGAKDALGQPLQIIGNEAAPASVILNPGTSYGFELSDFAYILVAGVTFTNTAGNGLTARDGATVDHRNCVFGAITVEKILTLQHAAVRAIGPTSVSGNSVSFVHATKRSIVDFASQTLTYVGNPVFSNYIFGINDAAVNLDSATIVGTASGGIVVHDQGILNVSSLTGIYTGGQAAQVDDGGIIAIKDKMEARNFYVRLDGNDANDGFANTAGRAFRTIQGAVNAIAKLAYNPIVWTSVLAGGVVINVATGTYNESVDLRDLRFIGGTLVGDEVTPANCVIQGVGNGVSAVGLNSKWFVRGFRIHAAGSYGIYASQGSQIQYRSVEFGSASSAQVVAENGGRAIADGDYKIVVGAPVHLFATFNSSIDIKDRQVTIVGALAFSSAFVSVQLASVLRASGATFVGAATGKRHDIRGLSIVDTNGVGANFFPGNVAGTTQEGGLLV